MVFVKNRAYGKGVIWKSAASNEEYGNKVISASEDGGNSKNYQQAKSSCGISASGLSITDNHIKNCNRLVKEKISKKAATKTWELGKSIGVSFSGKRG